MDGTGATSTVSRAETPNPSIPSCERGQNLEHLQSIPGRAELVPGRERSRSSFPGWSSGPLVLRVCKSFCSAPNHTREGPDRGLAGACGGVGFV